MAGKKKNKGRTSIFTNPFTSFKKKEKAIIAAGGALPKTGIKVTTTIKPKKKKKSGVKRLKR